MSINITLANDIAKCREVINTQKLCGNIDQDVYTALHKFCDTIWETYGASPTHPKEDLNDDV